MRELTARQLACIGALAALACGALSCGRSPASDDVAAVQAAIEDFERVRMESMLCLDQMDPEALVRATGSSDPCEYVIEEGDTTFGTIQSIGQLHQPPLRATSESEDEVIVLYQLAILQHLLARNARTVFVEGVDARDPIKLGASHAEMLRESFANVSQIHTLEQLDTRQFQTLRKGLATIAFLALRPHVELFGADDTSASARVERDAKKLDFFEAYHVLNEHRERVAMATVCRYLAGHRGREVYLVYGAGHIFERSSVPAGYRIPRIVMTTFPGLAAAEPGSQPWLVRRLGKEPGLVAKYLDRLESLNPECFDALGEPDQLHALKKRFLLTAEVPDADSLTRYLDAHAKSPRVRAQIEHGDLVFLPR